MDNEYGKNLQLKRVNLAVTRFCNLHCRMCDIATPGFWERNTPLGKIKEIIRESAELGVETMELTGGEAMVRKDIYEIISYAASLGLKVFMASNGVLVGEKEAKKLIEAGLTMITFSLEGPEYLNDMIRGKGNFNKTVNALKIFCGHRERIPELKVMVGIVISRYNYKLLLPFSKYLVEEFDVHTISMNPFNGYMLSEKNRKARENEFLIPPELIPDLAEEMEKLIQYGESVPGKLHAPGFLRRIPDYFMGKKLIPAGGCITPSTFCGISAQGVVFSCWHNPPIGNIKEASLTEILNSEAQKKSIELGLKGKCSGCLSSCYYEMYL